MQKLVREQVQELEKVLDNFRTMQETHKKALGRPDGCNLETLIFERSRAFADLKEHLSLVQRRIQEPGGAAVHIPQSCQSRLMDIWEAEQQLMDQVNDQRSRIAGKLDELTGYKKGLKGYARAIAMAARA